MYTLFVILIVIAALLMIGIVLIQESKGGGLASNFSSYNQIGGVRKTTDFIEKATWGLAAAMVVLSVFCAYVAPQASNSGSVMEGIEVPAFFTPMPAGSTREIKFISTYDVYYRDTDGNITTTLVRGDCTATNDWNLKAPTGQAFGAGKAISVSATVIPTYLYQLADPDLVDPTIKIGN